MAKKGDYRVRRLRALSGGSWEPISKGKAEFIALCQAQAQKRASAERTAATTDAERRERKAAKFAEVRAGERKARPDKREREAARRAAVVIADLFAPLRDGPDKFYSVTAGFAPAASKNDPADKAPRKANGLIRPMTERRAVKLGLLPPQRKSK